MNELSKDQIKEFLKPKTAQPLTAEALKKKAKLTLVNELRKQEEKPPLTKEQDMDIWDKRRWLVVQDYWNGHITKERADEMLANIFAKEQEARAA